MKGTCNDSFRMHHRGVNAFFANSVAILAACFSFVYFAQPLRADVTASDDVQPGDESKS